MPAIFKCEGLGGTSHPVKDFAFALVDELKPAFGEVYPGEYHFIQPYCLCPYEGGVTVGLEIILELIERGWESLKRPIDEAIADVAVIAKRHGLRLESAFVHQGFKGRIIMIIAIPSGWQPPP